MRPADLQRWLEHATHGLEPDLASMIRDELCDHYDDAYDDYRAQGYDALTAHTLTMRDLGDESSVQQGFQRVHHNRRYYQLYALVGILYPFIYMLSIPLNEKLVGDVVFNLAIFLPMIYIISSLRTLLRDHFVEIDFNKNIMLIRNGVIALSITRLLGWYLYHQPTIVESYGRSIFDAVSLWEAGLNFVSIAGLLLASCGFMFIGLQVLHLPDRLHGLALLLGYSVIIGGASFALYGVCSLMGMATLCQLAEFSADMAGILATLCCAFVFWRERLSSQTVTN